jgi:hypothetical protein
MSVLFDCIMEMDRQEVARQLAAHVRENAALRDRVGALEHELFWMKAVERDQQSPE